MRFSLPSTIAAAFIAATAFASADLTIVNEIESEGQTQEIVMKIKGQQARVDVNPQVSTILHGGSGDSIMLMHDQKRAMKIPGGSVQQMMEQLQAQQDFGADSGEAELKATGEKETINGFATERYTYTVGNVTTDLWIAEEFPNAGEALQQLHAFQSSGLNQLAQSAGTPMMNSLPGFPIRTKATVDGRTVTSTVKSVSQDDVAAASFQVPDGYQEMKIPMMPGAPAGE